MKILLIDSVPLTNNLWDSHDFTTKQVLSAVADTLFKYSESKDDIIPNAALNYRYYKNGKLLHISLRKNLFFYNGDKVKAKDYVISLEEVGKKNSQIGYFISTNVKMIKFEEYDIYITLNRPNYHFHKYLSNISISPQKDNILTSGPYYIKFYNNNKYILTRNLYYRNNKNEHLYDDLCFCFESGNNIPSESVFCSHLTGIIHQMNKNMNLIKSNIYVDLIFQNNKWFKKDMYIFRKIIFQSINMNEFEPLIILNPENIYFNEHNKKRINKNHLDNKSKKRISSLITLAYDDYYPNYIIAQFIKQQIEKNTDFQIKLIKDDYYHPYNNYDMKVYLTLPEFNDKTAYLTSPKFIAMVKFDNCLYKKYFAYIKKLLKSKDPIMVNSLIEKLSNIINCRFLRKRLFSLNFFYSCKNKKLNFTEFNYEILE